MKFLFKSPLRILIMILCFIDIIILLLLPNLWSMIETMWMWKWRNINSISVLWHCACKWWIKDKFVIKLTVMPTATRWGSGIAVIINSTYNLVLVWFYEPKSFETSSHHIEVGTFSIFFFLNLSIYFFLYSI